jgi:hypothetical protein
VKPKKIPETEASSEYGTYILYDSEDVVVLRTTDIFNGLDKLKLQSPGAKLTRESDGKTLAYTTSPKPEDAWIYNL